MALADPFPHDSLPASTDHEPPDDLEQRHFERVSNSFRLYSSHHRQKLLKSISFYDRMPAHQRQRLHPFRKHLNHILELIHTNALVMRAIVEDSEFMFENKGQCTQASKPSNGEVGECRVGTKPRPSDMEKTACVLRQIVREWTSDGEDERSQSFGMIINAVERYFGARDAASKQETRILVPGAGLGRLPHEIAKRGYATQGNEFSMFMLIASHFILNKCKQVDAFTIYPHVHQMNNVLCSSHQLKPVSFPDEDPSDIPPEVPFSMTAGNFVEIYSAPEYANNFHCIVTCFFMDTAHNILQYIETIHKALHANGIWINLGPLLYHFSEAPDEDSIEPCYDFVRDIIVSYGFQFLEEDQNVSCYYTQNPDSMLSYVYRCVFFVARKVVPTSSGDTYD